MLFFLRAFFFLTVVLSSAFANDQAVPPQFYLNDQSENLTVQELSGFATRPLRLLVERNNKKRDRDWIYPYALGVGVGDDLRMVLQPPANGERVTVYKIFREPKGMRYLTMPVSIFQGESTEVIYDEKVKPFREQFFIVVYENTGAPEVKNAHIRYFEERARKLVIASFRTNLFFSSLKFKMKDFAEDDTRGFFTESAQELMDRLIRPTRIYMLRLWLFDSDREISAEGGPVASSIIPIEKSSD